MRYAIVVVALLAAACSPDIPPAIPTPQPPRGVPSRLELTGVPGIGQTGGTAAISARVQDAYGATLPGVAVAFSSTAGTFTATPVQTGSDGVARTTLVAIAGVVQVSAQAGTVTSTPLTVAIQPHRDLLPPTPHLESVAAGPRCCCASDSRADRRRDDYSAGACRASHLFNRYAWNPDRLLRDG
jgi:hypothetical protein